MRIVPTRIHGAIDYLVSLLVLVLPFAAGGQGAVCWLFVAIGCAGIGYSLITDYEWGALRLLPMPWHLALDVVFGVALLAVGALLGFSPLGVISLVVGAAALALAAITEPEPRRTSRMAR